MRGQANGVEDRRPRGDDHEAEDHDDEDEDDVENEEEEEEGRNRGQAQGQGQGEGPPQQRRNQQVAQRPSSGPQQQNHQHQQPRPSPPSPLTRNVGYVGKHRLSAAIARLDQELQSLQEELDELETMESASAACQEVITSTEGKPDPLLPVTSGPENSSWDRWFQRVRSRSNKWWASKGSDFS